MPRRKVISKRELVPDPKYQSTLVTRFINSLMSEGEKSVAERIFYSAMESFAKKTENEDHLQAFEKALGNVKPMLEVKSRRVGGSTYQVPVEVPGDRRLSLAMRWIIDYSRKRGEKTMQDRLAAELVDCYNNTGNAVKKKEDTHRMAEANKAFAHYRW